MTSKDTVSKVCIFMPIIKGKGWANITTVTRCSSGNNKEKQTIDIKVSISEKSTEILRKFIFLTMFEKGKF